MAGDKVARFVHAGAKQSSRPMLDSAPHAQYPSNSWVERKVWRLAAFCFGTNSRPTPGGGQNHHKTWGQLMAGTSGGSN